MGGIPPSAILSIFKTRATSILKSVREERATQKIGQSAIGPPGWLEKGLSASLLVRYVSQRIRSSLAPSIQTLLKPTVCLLLMRRCTSSYCGRFHAIDRYSRLPSSDTSTSRRWLMVMVDGRRRYYFPTHITDSRRVSENQLTVPESTFEVDLHLAATLSR